MAKGKILMSQPIHEAGIKLITDQGYVPRVAPDFTEATLIKEVQDADGFLVRTAEIPASVINAGKVLKVIARHGVGYDNIDVKAATARKIPVCITPRANALSVAEHVIALMLALAKRMLPFDAATRKNEWDVRNSYSAFDLDGKTLGILGMGRIGMLVCQKAKAAFNMEILAYDPLVPKEAMEKAGSKSRGDFRDPESVGLRHAPRPLHGRDEGDDRHGAAQDDEALGIPHQLRPRTHRGRGGVGRGPEGRHHRRRGAGRVRSRAAEGR